MLYLTMLGGSELQGGFAFIRDLGAVGEGFNRTAMTGQCESTRFTLFLNLPVLFFCVEFWNGVLYNK